LLYRLSYELNFYVIPKYHNEFRGMLGNWSCSGIPRLSLPRPWAPEERMTESPEDIASLYSRARIEWTRYWDFSASRKQVLQQLHLGLVRAPLEWPLTAPSRTEAQLPPVQLQEIQTGDPDLPDPQPQAAAQFQGTETEPQVLGEPLSGLQGRPQLEPMPGAATRWYALRSIFAPAEAPVEPSSSSPFEQRPPVVVVFSLAGGVGKTCLVATLGRVLSALGEHVLLTETATCGLLPFYFGTRELRPGVVRTFFPPAPFGEEYDAPVQMLNLQGDGFPAEGSQPDPLLEELLRDGRGTSRIVVDVATANRRSMSRLLSLRPKLLVPILPDMSSVACLGLFEALYASPASEEKALYLLNQFDASSPLHLDVRAILQQQLGDRLLPFVLRRSPLVSEALAEGMTVIDYAPGSEDQDLAGWLRSLSAPAMAGSGVRWSER
jgi:cellulose synthase operon protein YhjQ